MAVCKQCGWSGPAGTPMRVHQLTHTGKSVICPKCRQAFSTRAAYDEHIKRAHAPGRDTKQQQSGVSTSRSDNKKSRRTKPTRRRRNEFRLSPSQYRALSEARQKQYQATLRKDLQNQLAAPTINVLPADDAKAPRVPFDEAIKQTPWQANKYASSLKKPGRR